MTPALQQCCRCKHAWKDLPGGWAIFSRFGCPKCGSLYFKWVDYSG